MTCTLVLSGYDVHAVNDDIQALLDVDGSLVELSPDFRRLLLDVDELLTAVVAGERPLPAHEPR